MSLESSEQWMNKLITALFFHYSIIDLTLVRLIWASVMPGAVFPLIRIAIVGGGPGGLSAAIALSKLSNVEVTIYEQARELREIGAGIQIGFHCWKVLELLDAAAEVEGHVHATVIHRCLPNLPFVYDTAD